MRGTRSSAIAVVLAVAATGGAAGVAAAAPSALLAGSTTPFCAEDGTGEGAGNGRRWGDGSGTAAQDGSGSAQGSGGQATRAGRGAGRGAGAWTNQSRGGTGNGGGGMGQGAGVGGSRQAIPPAVEGATVSDEVAAQLLYLVEEEKLAGDIYELAYDEWGLRVFGNIAGSEDRHAEEVGELLDRYGLADPSSEEAGEFSDGSLQALYEELADRVLTSQDEAVDVGLTIENKDIDDLQTLLAEDLPADVEQVVENLLAGSQRHQAAFARQA